MCRQHQRLAWQLARVRGPRDADAALQVCFPGGLLVLWGGACTHEGGGPWVLPQVSLDLPERAQVVFLSLILGTESERFVFGRHEVDGHLVLVHKLRHKQGVPLAVDLLDKLPFLHGQELQHDCRNIRKYDLLP